MHEPAVSFWQAIESKLLPAVRSGRQADIESAFEAAATLFARHRAGIDKATKIANDFYESVEAESALEKAVKLAPDDVEALNLLAKWQQGGAAS